MSVPQASDGRRALDQGADGAQQLLVLGPARVPAQEHPDLDVARTPSGEEQPAAIGGNVLVVAGAGRRKPRSSS